MKLQVALDTDLKTGLKVCKEINKHIDIIEIGTPLVKSEGLKALRKFKKYRKPLVADMKTMDTGFLEAEMAFKEGAEITTVCGSADFSTIKGAIMAGKKYKKKVLVDLINVKNKKKKAKKIKKLNPDYVCVHTGIDEQRKGEKPLKDLKKVSRILGNEKVAVAGGINKQNIEDIVKQKPGIIIVGGALTKAKNPEKVAKKLKEEIEKNEE